jgi:hypothetical protein
LLAALLGGCRRTSTPAAAGSRNLPKGDAVWLTDPRGAGEAHLEEELQKIGAAALFLPAGELSLEAGRGSFRADPAPPHPFQRMRVVLVVRPGAGLSAALTAPVGSDAEGMARAIETALSSGLAGGAPYGRVAGIHLDFPVTASTASGCAAIVSALRRFLPPGDFVSISLQAAPSSDAARKSLEPLLQSVDVLVAFVFGTQGRADPMTVDSLQRPWWAAYSAAAAGTLTGSNGQMRGAVAEKYLDLLSGNPHVELENDLSVDDPTISAFNFVARDALRIDDLALEPGARVAFRQPVLPEMLFQLGSSMAGKRRTLGRLILFEGSSDADRVFPMTAFEDVLLGRSLEPVLEANARALGHNAVSVTAENRSRHASVVSRISNWVEVDLAPAHPADLQLGGFDRYEVYDAGGVPVSPGRATRIRLFETLVAPMETILPARIVVRGGLPKDCCRHRLHLIAAAGPEVARDWTEPPPRPTPPPAKAPKGKRR